MSAEFVAPMEDVLDLYEEVYDPRYPTVCFDEKLVAPEADVRLPEPLEPGRPERVDYEYQRLGTATLFFFVELLTGWRHVELSPGFMCCRWWCGLIRPLDRHQPCG